MALLQGSTQEERRRLLNLFPVANLRLAFGDGSKEEICIREAAGTGVQQLRKIGNFVSNNFCCCKQHIYVFEADTQFKLPNGFLGGVRVSQTSSSAYYLAQTSFTVTIFNQPLSQQFVSILWPLKIEIIGGYYLVRFAILESDVAAVFGMNARVTDRSLVEDDILTRVAQDLLAADLNKGVKHLWRTDFHECPKGKFKKADSLSSEQMDEKKGIKQNYPAIYQEMLLSPIHTSTFIIIDGSVKIDTYSVNPTFGTIGFSKYSQLGDTDAVIRQILDNNN